MPSAAVKRFLNTLQIRNDYNYEPAGLRWRSNTLFITATVAVGLFTDIFLYGLVVPVLPFMLTDRIGIPDDQIQSHVSGLLAVFAASSVVASPLSGILADRMSTRQAPFLLGLLVLLLSTLLLFLGNTVTALVIARMLQGMSGALVWTIGLALCLETVGPRNLGKTIGTIFSCISVGGLCAPVLGGILYEKTGYLSVCAVALAIISADLLLRLLMIEKRIAARYNNDIIPDSSPIEDPIEQPSEHDADASEQEPLLGTKRSDENDDLDAEYDYRLSEDLPWISRVSLPILPCLKNPRLLTAFWIALVQALFLGSFDSTVPIVGQELFNFNSLQAGILFIPLGGTSLVFGPIFGWCVDRYGTKPVAVLCYGYLTPMLVLLRLPQPGGLEQMLLYGGVLLLCGLGFAGISSPSIVEAGRVVERYHHANPEHFGVNGPYAQLYSMTNLAFSLGLTVGPELAGELKNLIGYGNMNLALAVISAITAVLCFFFIGPKPRILRQRRQRKVGSEVSESLLDQTNQ